MSFNTLPQCVARGEQQPEPVIGLWLRIAVALTAFIVTFLILYFFVASLDVPVIPRRAGLHGGPASAVAERAVFPYRQVLKLCEVSPHNTDFLDSKTPV